MADGKWETPLSPTKVTEVGDYHFFSSAKKRGVNRLTQVVYTVLIQEVLNLESPASQQVRQHIPPLLWQQWQTQIKQAPGYIKEYKEWQTKILHGTELTPYEQLLFLGSSILISLNYDEELLQTLSTLEALSLNLEVAPVKLNIQDEVFAVETVVLASQPLGASLAKINPDVVRMNDVLNYITTCYKMDRDVKGTRNRFLYRGWQQLIQMEYKDFYNNQLSKPQKYKVITLLHKQAKLWLQMPDLGASLPPPHKAIKYTTFMESLGTMVCECIANPLLDPTSLGDLVLLDNFEVIQKALSAIYREWECTVNTCLDEAYLWIPIGYILQRTILDMLTCSMTTLSRMNILQDVKKAFMCLFLFLWLEGIPQKYYQKKLPNIVTLVSKQDTTKPLQWILPHQMTFTIRWYDFYEQLVIHTWYMKAPISKSLLLLPQSDEPDMLLQYKHEVQLILNSLVV